MYNTLVSILLLTSNSCLFSNLNEAVCTFTSYVLGFQSLNISPTTDLVIVFSLPLMC